MALVRLLFLTAVGLVGGVLAEKPAPPAPPAPGDRDEEKIRLKNKLVVLIKGIPGCGKTTAVQRICQGKTDWVSIELDPYKAKQSKLSKKSEKDKRKDAREEFIQDFTNYLDNEEIKVVFVSMNNSNPTHYHDCVNIANEKRWKVMAMNIADFNPNQKGNFVNSAATGLDREHATIANTTDSDKKEAYNTLLSFVVMYEPAIQGENGVHIVERLQWTKSGEPTSEFYFTYNKYNKKRVEGFDARRPIEEIMKDIVEMIDKHINIPMTTDGFTPIEVNRKPNPEEMYIKLKLSDEQQKQLKNSIPELKNISKELPRNFKHVTMMHRNGSKKNREHWLQLQLMKGTELTIVPYAYVSKEDTIVVMVNIEDPEGKNVNNLVSSGVPHSTGVLPKGTKPVKSMTIAKEAKPEEIKKIKEQHRFTSTLG